MTHQGDVEWHLLFGCLDSFVFGSEGKDFMTGRFQHALPQQGQLLVGGKDKDLHHRTSGEECILDLGGGYQKMTVRGVKIAAYRTKILYSIR